MNLDNLDDIMKPLENFMKDLDKKTEQITKMIVSEKEKLSPEEAKIINVYQKQIMDSAMDGDDARVQSLMAKMNEKLKNANSTK